MVGVRVVLDLQVQVHVKVEVRHKITIISAKVCYCSEVWYGLTIKQEVEQV